MQTRPAQIAIKQQNAIALLGERDSVVGAGKTFAFSRQSTGKERNLALALRSQERKRGAQIAECFRGRSLRALSDNSIGRSAIVISSAFRTRLGFTFCLGDGSEDGQIKSRFRLIDGLD